MKMKMLSAIGAVVAASAMSTSAHALDISKPSTVCLQNGYKAVPLGTWVVELNEYTDYNGYEACSYFVKWINANYLPLTTNLFIDELVVPGYLDCYANSYINFRTVLFSSPDYVSMGWDKFGQRRTVTSLILSEDGYGKANGVITFATNFPYPISVIDP